MHDTNPPIAPFFRIKVHKPKLLITVIVLFAVIVLSLIAWLNFPPNPNVLYDNGLIEAEKQSIRDSVLQEHGRMIRWDFVDPYYGKINGCYVVIMHPYASIPIEWQQEIAGYTFKWGEPIQLYVYSEEHGSPSSCELAVAYEKGWLTERQIGEIYKRHNEYLANFPQMMEQYLKDWKNSQK